MTSERVPSPPTDDVREALHGVVKRYAYRPTQEATDAILAAFEVRLRGPVTDAEESTPVKLLRMFVREHDEGDGPEQVAVEVSDIRHVLALLDAAKEARS